MPYPFADLAGPASYEDLWQAVVATIRDIVAVLVDVRTRYIYRVMETYGEESEIRPVAFLDEEGLEFEARRKALEA